MKYFTGINGEKYSIHDVKKANSRIIYWITFPQGIEIHRKNRTIYTSILVATTKKKAFKLANKYNAAWIERLIECDLGRWVLREFTLEGKSLEELWEEYKNLPEVIIGKEVVK